jgi:hypothetical protein
MHANKLQPDAARNLPYTLKVDGAVCAVRLTLRARLGKAPLDPGLPMCAQPAPLMRSRCLCLARLALLAVAGQRLLPLLVGWEVGGTRLAPGKQGG